MPRKFGLLALSGAALCAFVPSAASAQWYGGSSDPFGYISGYPYAGYDAGSYYDRSYYDRDGRGRWERRERWDRDDERGRYWNRDSGEHRGWRHEGDDDD